MDQCLSDIFCIFSKIIIAASSKDVIPMKQVPTMIEIRQQHSEDWDSLWLIFQDIIKEGTSYAYDAITTREQFVESWMGRGGEQWVACNDGQLLGAYTLRENQPGRGSHIATASYIVAASARGQRVGTQLGEHSIQRATELRYTGIQFNFVVSTNTAAVKLWLRLGFAIVGTLPSAFRHSRLENVDCYVMFKKLEPAGYENLNCNKNAIPK